MANEKRLIYADALEMEIERCREVCRRIKSTFTIRDVITCIKIAPTVDAVEVVHGRWEKSNIPQEKFCCSVCGGACWYYDYEGEVAKSRYCPNCGAKMDGGNEDG